MKSYSEELVFTTSEDGVSLEGLVTRPADVPAKPLAVIWTHGFTGHFDERYSITIGRHAATRGFTFISGNNRGHHFGAGLQRHGNQPFIGGGWWENVGEAPFDIGGWISFAAGLGFAKVVLAGHSLGTIKVTRYQAERQDPRVDAMILGSPPILGGARAGKDNPELQDRAARLVAEGRGEELIPGDWIPAISAQSYCASSRLNLDAFGAQTSEPAISEIRCPLLVCYGTNEAELVVEADVEIIRRNAVAVPRLDVRVIQGGDHTYTGREDDAGTAIAGWPETLA